MVEQSITSVRERGQMDEDWTLLAVLTWNDLLGEFFPRGFHLEVPVVRLIGHVGYMVRGVRIQADR